MSVFYYFIFIYLLFDDLVCNAPTDILLYCIISLPNCQPTAPCALPSFLPLTMASSTLDDTTSVRSGHGFDVQSLKQFLLSVTPPIAGISSDQPLEVRIYVCDCQPCCIHERSAGLRFAWECRRFPSSLQSSLIICFLSKPAVGVGKDCAKESPNGSSK